VTTHTTFKRRSTPKKLNDRKRPNSQIATRDSMIFQPWFLPIKTEKAVRRLLPPAYKKKMRDYFAKWGCIRCGKRLGAYGGNGFCIICHNKIHRRVRNCMIERANITVPNQYGAKYLADARNARKLLRGFPPKMYAAPKSHLARKYRTNNPARAAFIIVNNRASRKNR
jgi:hypothetical protein